MNIEPPHLETVHSRLRDPREALAGVLVGTAVGDALGLPMEGLSAKRQSRVFSGPLRHRFLAHRGMVSDDTEHTLMIAQSLLEAPADAILFQKRFARRLRWWLAALPAGVGSATARAIFRLWLGVSPARSGVGSAGNGPAMRSALLGVYFCDDGGQRRNFVRASTLITHGDPRAEIAAQAVAETAAWMVGPADDVDALLQLLRELSVLPEWRNLVEKLHAAHAAGHSMAQYARAIGAVHGVSGYAFQTGPVAIYTAVQYRADFAGALEAMIACGGDADTTGAIVGALVGARVGLTGIPERWREGMIDWPCSVALLQRVAERLAEQRYSGNIQGAAGYCWPAVPLRNLGFLALVLAHGFRRLLPPY
jgi:ADP-ribosyl-[dinitrogen reductase] hydrolase